MSDKNRKTFVRAVAIVLAVLMIGGCATALISMLTLI